jgi:23S rRNA (uracil1939-C5)-methyltransferase
MQLKSIIEISITDMSEEGAGIGRIDNRVVFVQGAIVGDTVNAQITKVKKNFMMARIIKVIHPSEHRIDPPCPYAYRCGGCSVQHLDYDEQLVRKQELVKNALERIGSQTDFILHDIVGMTFPYHYRNKALYPADHIKGEVVFGFYKAGSHTLVPIEECMIQHKDNAGILAIIKKWANDHQITVYNEKTHRGLLRHILIRSSIRGEHMIGFILNGDTLPYQDELSASLIKDYPSIVSIMKNKQTNRGNTVMGLDFANVYGTDTIMDSIDELEFELAMPSFFQVNPEQTTALYDKALEYAALTGTEVVWDIYSGAGTISLKLAKNAKKVIGNEIVDAAVENAIDNAKRNNIQNVEFIAGPAEIEVPKWLDENGKVDVVVLDPPRKGAEIQVLEAIITMNPDRIVYVSCKPSTLARDIKHLTENGYKLVEVTPVDMFPHSMHVETVVRLQRVIR